MLCKCGIYRTVIATDSKSSAISAFALAQIWAKLSKCGIWMYKMKFSCYQESLLFMASLFLGFWLRNTPLVKVGNPISDGIVFHLAWYVRGLKSLKRFWPYLIVFSASRMVSLSGFHVTSSPPCWWTVNKRSLFVHQHLFISPLLLVSPEIAWKPPIFNEVERSLWGYLVYARL